MYIEPFWCGVISVFLAEAVIFALLIARCRKAYLNEEDDKTNED